MQNTLVSNDGMVVDIAAEGACVLRVCVANRAGQLRNIALAPQRNHQPPSAVMYAGATLGPTAGRIRKGQLQVEKSIIQLPCNEGAHHLHGGFASLSDLVWDCEGYDAGAVRYVCKRTQAQDGYPGTRRFEVTYTLAHRLRIALKATSDEPTVVNLSNHLYWNLTGDFSTSIADHVLRITANSVWHNDAEHLPTQCCPVRDTVFDFSTFKTLREGLEQEDAQLAIAHGYNHCYQLCGLPSQPSAQLQHPACECSLQLYTDAPGLVVYSGGYLSLVTEDGVAVGQSGALALEPQALPYTNVHCPTCTSFSRVIEYAFPLV